MISDEMHDDELAAAAVPPPETIAATEASLPAAPAAAATKPDDLPAELWDDASGAVQPAALLEAWRTLNQQLGTMLPVPSGPDDVEARERLLLALGRPVDADGYGIASPHPLLPSDPAINARLHAAGFTGPQAQTVYELAAEVMLPVVDDALATVAAERETERLVQEFGGRDAWTRAADQLRRWGSANLDAPTFATLSTTADGVLAMQQMMRSREPTLVGDVAAQTTALDGPTLNAMVADPRYWRDREPEFVARVTDGFRRLYGA